MPDLYIDSFKFACPEGKAGLEIFEIYIYDILALRDLLNANWLELYISAKLTEVLTETDSYPPWKDVERAMNYLNLQDEIQPSDIFYVMNELFKKGTAVEDKLGIEEILTDNYQCVPSYHYSDRPRPFIENYEDFTSKICFRCHLNGLQNGTPYFLTANLKNEDESVCVKTEILDCDFVLPDHAPEFPLTVRGTFSAASNADGFRLQIDPITIWKNAEDEESYSEALEIYIHQRRHRQGDDEKPVFPWSFGSEFITGLKGLKFLNKDEEIAKLLRTLAAAVLNENLQNTHPLRRGKGGDDPQRVRERDGAKAWPRDIDRKFHLHYWQTSDEIEFAWAAYPHDDYYIPE